MQYGDATELWVLERAGIQRADLVVAVTGDDEDNLLICQVAKEKYLCERIIARVNNPRNLVHFKLLGIQPAVSATDLILRLIEHEVPRYGLVHLLDLPEERLEIIELEVADGAPVAGRRVAEHGAARGLAGDLGAARRRGFVPTADTVVEAGDEVLVVLDPGLEEDITARFVADGRRRRAADAERSARRARAPARRRPALRRPVRRLAAQHPRAVGAALDLPAGHQLAERGGHRRAPRADHARERAVRQAQRDEDPAGHDASPALGEHPEQREQALVDAREVRDRRHHARGARRAAASDRQRGEDLRPRVRPRRSARSIDREAGRGLSAVHSTTRGSSTSASSSSHARSRSPAPSSSAK